MDIRKISLQLSGKTPPEYKKHNRLEFMEMLEDIFGLSLEKLDFYWKQAKEYEEEFYFLVLELLHNKSLKDGAMKTKFEKLIKDLNLSQLENKLVLGDYKDEEDFTKNFLLDFFKKLGYKDVKYTHGRKEYGKDIIMRKMDEFGNWRYIGVQSKVGDVSGKIKGPIDELVGQAQDGFGMKVPSLDEKDKVSIAEFVIVTDGKFTENAKEKIIEKIKEDSQKNNITFIDKEKIENLLYDFK